MFGQSKASASKIMMLLIIGALCYTGVRFLHPDDAAADPIMPITTDIPGRTDAVDATTHLPEESPAKGVSDIPASTSQVQQVNGITIELDAIQKAGEYVQASVCYQLPSAADWLLGNSASDVVLTLADKTIPLWGGSLIEWKTAPDGAKTHRCDRLLFPVAADQDLSALTLTIKRLATSVPEQPDCDRAQEKLTQAGTGIQIQCQHSENAFGYTVEQRPTTMSEGEAQKLVYEAFSEIVQGPWVFTTGLK